MEVYDTALGTFLSIGTFLLCLAIWKHSTPKVQTKTLFSSVFSPKVLLCETQAAPSQQHAASLGLIHAISKMFRYTTQPGAQPTPSLLACLPDKCALGLLQAARKVYDTALGSLPSIQASSSQQHAASLALAYAESELSRGGVEAPVRALHVLAWLGTGGPFTPFKSPGKGKQSLIVHVSCVVI